MKIGLDEFWAVFSASILISKIIKLEIIYTNKKYVLAECKKKF